VWLWNQLTSTGRTAFLPTLVVGSSILIGYRGKAALAKGWIFRCVLSALKHYCPASEIPERIDPYIPLSKKERSLIIGLKGEMS
jgi:hypothetical protein